MGSLPGQVITFYSYKGGTGRTMALANIACLLARGADEEKGVLMVDWDLDAPGLHEYFRTRFQRQFADAREPDRELDDRPGVIDLFRHYWEALRELPSGRAQSREEARRLVEEIDPLPRVLKTDVPGLDLLKAGRVDSGYSASVSTFPWEDLYKRSPWLVRAFADRLTGRYRHVLVDSRTGLNDISGICTMLLPERLVAVFTPNRQSLFGVYDLIRRATNYRRQSPDLRPLVAFPLPSRIDAERGELRKAWRYGDPDRKIEGFQTGFEQLFQEVYELEECSLEEYFGEVQVQHTPDFAYGEEIAVLTEWGTDRFDLTRSYERFAHALVHAAAPWALSQGPDLDLAQERARMAEAAFSRLSPEQQDDARRIFTRLVRLSLPGEGGRDTGIAAPRIQLAGDRKTVDALLAERVLKIDERNKVELADESLIQAWARLGKWLQEDREFLLWRQGLRSAMLAWLRGQPQEALLTGKALQEARRWLNEKRNEDLNASELEYIFESEALQGRRAFLKGLAAAMVLVVLVISGFWIKRIYEANLYQNLLESWGLPADLYEHQGQLRALTLPSTVSRLDWLAEGLEELTLNEPKAQSLEGLPASLRSLEVTRSPSSGMLAFHDLTGLPAALESLQFQAPLRREPSGLPANLRRLALLAPLESLAGLPSSLVELSLAEIRVQDLKGLPPGLKSLELSDTTVVSLDGLPTSVENLALVGNQELRQGELRPGLRSLWLEKNPLYEPVLIPKTLRSLTVDFPPGLIPRPLESLALLKSVYPPGSSLPQGLTRLEIPAADYGRLVLPIEITTLKLTPASSPETVYLKNIAERLPILEELDLRNLRVGHLAELPRRLVTLRVRFESMSEIPPLPLSLVVLDLSGSAIFSLPKLPPSLRELSVSGTRVSILEGLPSELTALDISGTPVDSLRGLPPKLRKLTLTTGQVRSLTGLPESVVELVFVDDDSEPPSP